MPTYSYRCVACGFEWEEIHSIKDDFPRTCNICCGKGEQLIRGGVGFINLLWKPGETHAGLDIGRFEKSQGYTKEQIAGWETAGREKEEQDKALTDAINSSLDIDESACIAIAEVAKREKYDQDIEPKTESERELTRQLEKVGVIETGKGGE